jgi:CRISPR-associated endoribonuclease Cas6
VVSLEVRSPLEELVDELARQLAMRDGVRIGEHALQVVNLECRDRLLFPQRAVISMEAPVVAYTTLEDGHTKYYEPREEGWTALVQGNAARKVEALGLECGSAPQLVPLSETLKKQVTRFKGTYVTGWTGDFIIAAEPQLVAALWCLGLGAKNSQGFGMFRISEKPL